VRGKLVDWDIIEVPDPYRTILLSRSAQEREEHKKPGGE
jgi:hypothetical protein